MGNQQGSSSFYMERGKPSTVKYPSSLGSGEGLGIDHDMTSTSNES